MCDCKIEPETAEHLFLYRTCFANERRQLLNSLDERHMS